MENQKKNQQREMGSFCILLLYGFLKKPGVMMVLDGFKGAIELLMERERERDCNCSLVFGVAATFLL